MPLRKPSRKQNQKATARFRYGDRRIWAGRAVHLGSRKNREPAFLGGGVTCQWDCAILLRGGTGDVRMLKKFKELSEREILALAIQNEEEDGRVYGEFADALKETFPATAKMF